MCFFTCGYAGFGRVTGGHSFRKTWVCMRAQSLGGKIKSFSLLLQHLCSGGSDGTLSSRFLTAGKEVFLLPSSAALTLACQVPREGGVAVRRIC